MNEQIDFYFDFLSPFSFFANGNLNVIKTNRSIKINYYPVMLAKILAHHEIKAPAEINSKREYLFKTCLRYAKKNNLQFTAPLTHPFNPLYALRLATKECSEDSQINIINLIWEAGWVKGLDIGNPEVLISLLNSNKIDGLALMDKTSEQAIKKALKDNTDRAIALGAFGVPTFIVNDKELFWGNDSISDIFHYLDGKDFLDQNRFNEINTRTSKIF